MILVSIRKAALLCAVGCAGVSLAWSMVDGGGGTSTPEPVLHKCVPAVPTGPADECPAGSCRPAPICSMLEKEGGWSKGGCQTGGTECTDTSTDNVPNKMVKCQPVACTGGFVCGWVSTGVNGTGTSTVKSCNG